MLVQVLKIMHNSGGGGGECLLYIVKEIQRFDWS